MVSKDSLQTFLDDQQILIEKGLAHPDTNKKHALEDDHELVAETSISV